MIAEDIRKNVNNGRKIWQVKRRIIRKKEVKYLIKCDNKTIQDQQKMIKEYENYYGKLLKMRKAESEKEKEAEKKS